MGAATGSLCYYATDALMLSEAGKAEKRAAEIREELIGMVSVPVKQATEKVKEVVLAPLQDKVQNKLTLGVADIKSGIADLDLKKTWNQGVQGAFSTVSNLVGGSSVSKTE